MSDWNEWRGLDNHIAGGRYRKYRADASCAAERRKESCNNAEDCKHEVPCDEEVGCGWEGTVTCHEEYGTVDIEPEECPECGGPIEVDI